MKNITWYGQGSIRIATDGKVIYTDPFMISKSSNDADIILITHRHFDHLSVDDIEKIINDNTIIAAPADCVEEIKENFDNEIIVVNPGEEYIINDIKIQTVRAYNIIKKNAILKITTGWAMLSTHRTANTIIREIPKKFRK